MHKISNLNQSPYLLYPVFILLGRNSFKRCAAVLKCKYIFDHPILFKVQRINIILILMNAKLGYKIVR